MTPDLPIEFIVRGTAVSLQGSSGSKTAWKEAIAAAGRNVVPGHAWALTEEIAVIIYYFPEGEMPGDVDNIVKPILDAMAPFIYLDDKQVDRVVVQRFDADAVAVFKAPSATLLEALTTERPALYIRVTDNPFEEYP